VDSGTNTNLNYYFLKKITQDGNNGGGGILNVQYVRGNI
jgi:hypothetical protein